MQGDKARQREEEGNTKKSSLTSGRTAEFSRDKHVAGFLGYVHMPKCR